MKIMTSAYRMIDVGEKPITRRVAIASGVITVGKEAFPRLRDRTLFKGDALALAEIAAVTGAKDASRQIALCHPLTLDQVRCLTELDEATFSVRATCIAVAHGRTGVEMEALSGVSAALLTIWDLTKSIEPDLLISDVKLLGKSGGKSGVWLNQSGTPQWVEDLISPPTPQVLEHRHVSIITLSDRAHRGEYPDLSGEQLTASITSYGANIASAWLIPDEADRLQAAIKEIMASPQPPDLIICTGGTGVAARDITPDTILALFDREIPGVGELLRSSGANFTPLSWASRAVGGVIGRTLVVTLPGSPRAVAEGMEALLPELLPHLIRIIRGES